MNPEVSFGVDLNLIFAREWYLGLEAKHRFPVRNIIEKKIDGKESIEHGLRGNLGTGRVDVSISLRKVL